ncbi:MAG TPA: hypothetical protein VKA59_26775 [Vicinamibacterales bacterium]|nr:hypothetical protein [Vicinamibacterales bacterium]
MQVRRVLALLIAMLFVSVAAPLVAQRTNDKDKPQPARSAQEQADIQALVQAVEVQLLSDVGITVPPPGSQPPATPPTAKPLTLGSPDKTSGDVPVTWDSNHFVKGQTDTYIPFTLQLDKSTLPAGAAVWVRIVNAEQAAAFASMVTSPARQANNNKNQPPARTTFAWDNGSFVDVPEGGKLQRAIQLRPGQYVAYIAVKEKSAAAASNQRGNDRNRNDKNTPPAAAPGKVGVLRHELTVPDFGQGDLTTSSVIVARSVEQVATPPSDQESNPYVFGPMRIVPSPDGKFGKSAELSVIFWIYGAQAAASGKPDVTIDYNFYQKMGDSEKYFNKTAPQQLNAQTLPPEFSVAAGHQLPGSLVVPLASFPAADYRLEIKVTDKASGKSVMQNVNFTVLPV